MAPNFSQFTVVVQDHGTWRLLSDENSDSYAAQFSDGGLIGLYEEIGPRAGIVTDYQGNRFSMGEAPAWNWYDRNMELVGSSYGLFDRVPEIDWGMSTATPEPWKKIAEKHGTKLSRIHPAPVWAPTDGTQLWRNSEFTPAQIFANGFKPEGKEVPNLLNYVYNSRKNTTYISLTTTENYVEKTAWQSQVPAYAMKYRWAYAINLPHGAINVNATLDIASPFPDQQEYIVPGHIPPKYIQYAREIDRQTGALSATPVYNANYSGGSSSVAQSSVAAGQLSLHAASQWPSVSAATAAQQPQGQYGDARVSGWGGNATQNSTGRRR
ncbi:hypothetical protein OG211_15970 [Streptomyces niveus]|uniref:scabin-related ADP-ribosyltransferase n=1 Tax=Streptomyces niveus TaxID=193462 RepID=UPI0038632405|nr:hypothetical protein OG211_15970 [Streptomyces niveus]